MNTHSTGRSKSPQLMRLALAALIAATALARPAAADERGHRRGGERERHEAWGGDIHRFHEHDYDRWRGGRWYQGPHAGRRGWWWIVGGVWYFYPAPVYPYPDPYLPPVVVARPAPAPAPAPVPVQQYWYYCRKPAGYYPYVPRCATAWQAVPASPPPGPVR